MDVYIFYLCFLISTGVSTLPSLDGTDMMLWRKRQSMLFATADDNTSEDDVSNVPQV